MDKKIFLFDKEVYNECTIKTLTEKDCEEWVAENDYEADNSILKIDANGYDTIGIALEAEVGFLDFDDFYIRAFGFDNLQDEYRKLEDASDIIC